MAGRTTWSILSVQKSVKQEKSKETYWSPLQDCQYSEGSATDGLQALRQVQASLLNPRKVPLHPAAQVISPASPSDGKAQGDVDILHQDYAKAPLARSAESPFFHRNSVAVSGVPPVPVCNHHHSLRDISSLHLTAELPQPVLQSQSVTLVLIR